jgi:hypothetical protein
MLIYRMSCPKGEIMRKGYQYKRKTSKKAIRVSPTCIEDRGQPGKGPKLITIPKYDVGLLSKYEYELSNNHMNRVKSLKRAMKNENNLKVLRHLNAIRTLNKSNEKIFNKLDKDMKWLQKYYEKK